MTTTRIAALVPLKESVMVRSARILLLLAALGGPAMTTARAQAPATPEAATLPAPHALASAPPTPTFAPAAWPGPYFEVDPFLDRPPLPQPGLFANVDLGVVIPHVTNHMTGPVQLGVVGPVTAITSPIPNTVALPSAGLDWTVFPRIEVGYQLPSGFGAFALSYRFLGTQGNGTATGPDGPAALHSRLSLNDIGLDYIGEETSLWPNWDVKWAVGGRLLFAFTDSRADESPALAATGSTVFEQKESDYYWGLGPHAGLELDRQIADTGLALVLRGDFSFYLGRQHQKFAEASTGGRFGETIEHVGMGVPNFGTFAGIRWQPPQWKDAEFYFGYQYEHWWTFLKNDNTLSTGQLNVQGIFARAVWHF
jgi:hypothetical protein